MKTLLVAIMMLLALSSPVQSEDMQEYLSDTQKMVRQGQYQQALERFIWFHDHALEHDRAMYGVRLSFALSYWKALADVYPPAQQALVEMRDRKTQQLAAGKGKAGLFQDVASLNHTLQEGHKTVTLFEQLDRDYPELAQHCWYMAKDAVMSAKRYDLLRKYLDHPVKEFGHLKTRYEQTKVLYGRQEGDGAPFKAYNEDHFVTESLRLIAVAVALGDEAAAQEVRQKALAVIEDDRLRHAQITEKPVPAP